MLLKLNAKEVLSLYGLLSDVASDTCGDSSNLFYKHNSDSNDLCSVKDKLHEHIIASLTTNTGDDRLFAMWEEGQKRKISNMQAPGEDDVVDTEPPPAAQ